MKLLTKEIERRLPRLYSQEHVPDPIVQVKFFDPQGYWRWYGIEYDKKQKLFFGLVSGLELELGYFSLDELSSYRGRFGLGIERDLYFDPQPLSVIRELEEERRGGRRNPCGRRNMARRRSLRFPGTPAGFRFPKSEWTFDQCVDWLFRHGHKEPLYIEHGEKAEFWHFEVRDEKDFASLYTFHGKSPTLGKKFQVVLGRLTKAAERKRRKK